MAAINMNGSHLASNANYDFQRQNNFECVIGGLGQEITLCVSKAFLPEVSLDVVEIPYMNGKAKMAGLSNFESGSLEIRDAIGYDIEKKLYDWFKLAFDWDTGKMQSSTVYKKTITVHEYSGDGSICRSWQLDGCWISTFTGGDLDYSSGDVKVVTLTIQYDKAKRL
jgi:phage tail-like protein